jgi:hypothetical protein
LTENGLVRVVSSPAYPGRGTTVSDALSRLARFRRSGHHVFWEDAVSLCDPGRIEPAHIAGSRQVTDAYLLALAVAMGGRLVSFDRKIALTSVRGAETQHLVVPG